MLVRIGLVKVLLSGASPNSVDSHRDPKPSLNEIATTQPLIPAAANNQDEYTTIEMDSLLWPLTMVVRRPPRRPQPQL